MHPLIETNRAEILALAERHGVGDVRVFGSMARGDAGDVSDVDLLVSLPPGKTGLALGRLPDGCARPPGPPGGGRDRNGLYPAIRDRILREAQPL